MKKTFQPRQWWRWPAILGLFAFIALAANDLFEVAWGTGAWLGQFSLFWSVAFFGGSLYLLGLLVVCALALFRPRVLGSRVRLLIAIRKRIHPARWPILLMILVVTAWAWHFADRNEHWTGLLEAYYLRNVFFLHVAGLAGILLTDSKTRLLDPLSVVFGLTLLGVFLTSAGQFTGAINYPFSLGWSEGNRLYDYSLIFGQDRYSFPGRIVNPYGSPIRYGLWGLAFLIKELPIGAHRAWNALLYVLPVTLAAWCFVRPVKPAAVRWTLVLWLVLFLNQGPIYPHLLVPALVVLIFLYHPSPYVRAGSALVSSLLLGFSRWTWAVGPGIWAGLVDLLVFYPQRKGSLFRRLAPTVLIGLAGVLPGAVPTWAVSLGNVSSSLTFKQPLLFYRLFPNPTFPPGLLLATLIASAPVVIFLIWLVLSRRWRMDWVQIAIIFGGLTILLVAGIVISLKIGGGGNLHNLDLYLVTLALIVGLYFVRAGPSGRAGALYPVWVKAVIAVAILIPYYGAVSVSSNLAVPAPANVHITLQVINDQIAASSGEVLFIDQRQLLTFGFVPAIPFIPEYEKKFMTDQAMAANREYFLAYYRDLAARRFKIIVTEPLWPVYEDPFVDDYAEENNAWVFWVAKPTLCFYEPLYTFEDTRVQLLVPRAYTSGCAGYVQELP